MLIYNANKEFVGIDEKDLKILGFSNLSQLKSEAEDFADLFMRTTGYIHNFQHVHWIDFVECADASQESKVIIKVKGASFEANLLIDTLYLSNHPSSKAYLIHLHHLRRLGAGAPIPTMPAFEEPKQAEKVTPQTPPPSRVTQNTPPTLMETTPVVSDESLELNTYDIDDEDVFVSPSPSVPTKEEPAAVAEDEEEYEDDGYVFDPHVASEQLGLPIDLIEEFIQDFIAQAKEFKDELYASLADEDIANIATLSHKLKGVAANLRIEDALNTLIIINEAKDLNTIESNLKHFYKIIARLSGEEVKVAKNSSLPEVTSNTDDDDEFVLDFKEEQIEPALESKAPAVQEEVEEQEDELVLELDDDVFAAEEPFTQEQEEDTPKVMETPSEDDSDDELILDFKSDREENIKDDVLEIQDEDVPAKIEMLELEDDDFIAPETLEETLEVEDELFLDEPVEEEIEIDYPKELIASSIGLDIEIFEELLSDYVTDTTALSSEIHEALKNDDFATCSKNAVMIKGMSESIHMKSFESEIECLIQASDKQEMIAAINTIDKVIKQISKKA